MRRRYFFQESIGWKDRLNGYCPCFTGGANKIGLNNDKSYCKCNGADLKFNLLSTLKLSKMALAKSLIKISIFTNKEIDQAIAELTKNIANRAQKFKARKELEKEGYYIFNDHGIIRAYQKDRI